MQAAVVLAALALGAPLPLAASPVRTDHAEAELHLRDSHAVPGERVWVGLRLRPDAGWHTYWQNPGDSGLPTRIDWQLPAGVEAGAIQWPAPEIHRLADIVNYGYGSEILLPVALQLPAELPAGELQISARAEWLICSDICVPEQAQLQLRLPVAQEAPRTDPVWGQDFAAAFDRIPQPQQAAAAVAADAGRLRLRLPLPDDLPAGLRGFRLYPAQAEVVDHSAPQALHRADGALWLEQPLNPYFEALPQDSEWVLAAYGTADAPLRAWQFRARPQAPGPVPAEAEEVSLPYPESKGGSVVEPAFGGGASLAAGGTAKGPGSADDSGNGRSRTVPPPGMALPLVLLAAFVGGLILNLMPCVFPVLAIKALSVLEAQGETRRHQRLHGLVYTAGVVSACVLAAALLLALRAGGQALGWGFQLQSPVFIAVLACLFFAFGLSLSGVFTLGTRIMGLGQTLTEKQGLAGSFNTGVLAVVVASPCTAPFMGSALGYAVTQPAASALLIFMLLGFGLAAPFLLVGFVPQIARYLPRPGPWMERFKQLMAFPLYLSVAWLLWVLSRQAGSEALLAVLVAMVLLAMAAWLWHAPQRLARATRVLALLAALALVLSPVVRDGHAAQPVGGSALGEGEPWSPERVAALRAAGDTVFVNFTADWCITCLANERVVFGSEAIRELLARADIHYLKADWTRSDARITEALAAFGRNGVPLYLVYHGAAEAQVLPQILTPETLRRALLDEG